MSRQRERTRSPIEGNDNLNYQPVAILRKPAKKVAKVKGAPGMNNSTIGMAVRVSWDPIISDGNARVAQTPKKDISFDNAMNKFQNDRQHTETGKMASMHGPVDGGLLNSNEFKNSIVNTDRENQSAQGRARQEHGTEQLVQKTLVTQDDEEDRYSVDEDSQDEADAGNQAQMYDRSDAGLTTGRSVPDPLKLAAKITEQEDNFSVSSEESPEIKKSGPFNNRKVNVRNSTKIVGSEKQSFAADQDRFDTKKSSQQFEKPRRFTLDNSKSKSFGQTAVNKKRDSLISLDKEYLQENPLEITVSGQNPLNLENEDLSRQDALQPEQWAEEINNSNLNPKRVKVEDSEKSVKQNAYAKKMEESIMYQTTSEPSYLLDVNLSKTRETIAVDNIALDDSRIDTVGAVHYAQVKPRMFQPSYDHQQSDDIMKLLEEKIAKGQQFWQQEVSEVNKIVEHSNEHYANQEYFNPAYAHVGMSEGAKNTCTVIVFDVEKGTYKDQDGNEIDPKKIAGKPLIYDPVTKSYADIDGKPVDLKDTGAAILQNPETGGYTDVDGNEIDPKIVDNILKFDEEKGAYFDVKGNRVDPKTVTYALIYDAETKSYQDLSGKPVDTKMAGEMVLFDPETGTYKDVAGNEINKEDLGDALVFDPAAGGYRDATGTVVDPAMMGKALVMDPETGMYTDSNGNQFDQKMADNVLFYDVESGGYFDYTGKKVGLDKVDYAVIYDPAVGAYQDTSGKAVDPNLAADLIVFDAETGTYKDICGKEVESEALGDVLVFDQSTGGYRDVSGTIIVLAMKDKALVHDSQTDKYSDSYGNEIDPKLAQYVVAYDAETDAHYNFQGKQRDPAKCFTLIYSSESQGYVDSFGKPAEEKECVNMVLFDPETGTYKDISGQVKAEDSLGEEIIIHDPSTLGYRDVNNTVIVPTLKGKALVYDPKTQKYTDSYGNDIDSKLAQFVVIYDDETDSHYNFEGRERIPSKCFTMIYSPEIQGYVDSNGKAVDQKECVDVVLFDPETGTYADISGKVIEEDALGDALIHDPSTSGYRDATGTEIDPTKKGKALTVDPETGACTDENGIQVSIKAAPFIVTFDETSQTYFDPNGKVVDPTKTLIIFFDKESDCYIENGGKPFNVEAIEEIILFNPDKETYVNFDGQEIEKSNLSDAIIYDPSIKSYRDIEGTIVESDIAGVALKFDAELQTWFDVNGNKVDSRIAENVLIFDPISQNYYNAKGKQADPDQVALSLIFDPENGNYKNPDGDTVNPARVDVDELLIHEILSDDVYIATSSDDDDASSNTQSLARSKDSRHSQYSNQRRMVPFSKRSRHVAFPHLETQVELDARVFNQKQYTRPAGLTARLFERSQILQKVHNQTSQVASNAKKFESLKTMIAVESEDELHEEEDEEDQQETFQTQRTVIAKDLDQQIVQEEEDHTVLNTAIESSKTKKAKELDEDIVENKADPTLQNAFESSKTKKAVELDEDIVENKADPAYMENFASAKTLTAKAFDKQIEQEELQDPVFASQDTRLTTNYNNQTQDVGITDSQDFSKNDDSVRMNTDSNHSHNSDEDQKIMKDSSKQRESNQSVVEIDFLKLNVQSIQDKAEIESMHQRRAMALVESRQNMMSSMMSPKELLSPKEAIVSTRQHGRQRSRHERLARKTLKATDFYEKIREAFEQTCQGGHQCNLKCKRTFQKSEEDDQGWTSTLIRHCNTCWEEIVPGGRYIRCVNKLCTHSYCLKCTGCPKGHTTNVCRVNKHYEGGPCMWCQQDVKPEKGFVRLCLECMEPVCYVRCIQDVYDGDVNDDDDDDDYGDDSNDKSDD